MAEIRAHINAGLPTVFRLASEVELWPALIPHVRSARVLQRRGQQRLVAVRVCWHGLPLAWRAIHTLDRDAGTIAFRQVTGPARGSTVRWRIVPAGGGGVDVSMGQTARVWWPLPGRGFVLPLAERVGRELGETTLARIKQIAEGGSLAGRE